MNRKIVLVVGDKFARFAVGKDVLTLSQLLQWVDATGTVVPSHSRIVFVAGQGLSDADIENVLMQANRSPQRSRFDFSHWHSLPKRAAASKSHKHKPENTLISEPYRLAEDVFEMHLLIDERCELMLDHQTGQHLQGMLFVEAARQSQVAITETFFMPKDGEQYSFILNDLSVVYNHFAFPFPAKLRCVIREKDSSKPKRQSIVSDISIIQNGMDTVSLTIKTSIAESSRMQQRENRLAEKAIDNYMLELAQQLDSLHSHHAVVNG